jgi:zinc protease
MLDRKTPPLFQKTNSFELIKPERVVLPNGLAITIVRGGEQEVVKIELIFKAAKWQESQRGISYFTTHLLSKGTTTKNSFQISNDLDQFGVHLEVHPGFDFTTVALLGLTKNMDRFVKLLHEVITQPTFPEIELQQTKDIYIQGLKINLEKTSFLASKQIRQSLFGADHPYGNDATVEDIEKLQRGQLVDFHHTNFRDVEIICSGKVPDSLIKALSDTFEKISIAPTSPRSFPKKDNFDKSVFIEKSNSVQSSLRLGRKMISRTHTDYPPLLLLNHILGGFFGSRLMKNIREEKGLTYGIYSSIGALKHDSYLSIGADVNRENRELAIGEIKLELKNLYSSLIDQDELETAKNHFIGSLQAELTTPFAHADKIKNMMLYTLPDGYYQTLVNRIDATNQNELQEIAQRYFNEEDFAVVAVG